MKNQTKSVQVRKSKPEIQLNGDNVVLTGALAECVGGWLDHSEKPADLAAVIGAFVGKPPEKLRKVEIELPENLLAWITEEAVQGQGYTLGQIICYALETVRYAETRMFGGWKGGAK